MQIPVEEFKKIPEKHNVVKGDFWNHLRNVWFGGINKHLPCNISMLLKYKIDDIDARLRVSISIQHLLRAFNKEFRFFANYQKVQGEVFHTWME